MPDNPNDPHPQECCLKCRYWQEIDDENQKNCSIIGDSAGACRRYPPQIDAAMRYLSNATGDMDEDIALLCAYPDHLDFRFPIVMSWQWCGEFSPPTN